MRGDNTGRPNDNATVYIMAFGVDDLPPIEGTWDELRDLLDGYPVEVVQRIFFAEAALRTPLSVVIRPYLARRYVEYFCGPE